VVEMVGSGGGGDGLGLVVSWFVRG